MTCAPRSLYVHGRGLACALGDQLPDALQALQRPPPPVHHVDIGATRYAYRPIAGHPIPAPTDATGWWHRCAQLLKRVVGEAGATGHEALILTSSSFNMGFLERGGAWKDDGQRFVDDVAVALAWSGSVYAVNTACTSAFNGLRLAADLLHLNLDDPDWPGAVVLGLEVTNRYALSGFAAMQLITPLDGPDDGMVLGEAIAALRVKHTPARWRLAGSGHVVWGQDPGGTTATALQQAILQALTEAKIPASQIGLVRSHTTGRPPSDAVEQAVLTQLLPHTPPCIALKPYCGHTQGASGVAELALLTATLELDLPPIAAHPHWSSARHVLALGMGFGGGHAALILEDTHVQSPQG